mgnify:CR=1 FL=1|tara:strand:+ start:326 stop:550 length:225 start_codon:yes stop_codon:yes gene_type:complete
MKEKIRPMGEFFAEYEAELLAKSKEYESSQAAIDDRARSKARAIRERKQEIIWRKSLSMQERIEERKERFDGED